MKNEFRQLSLIIIFALLLIMPALFITRTLSFRLDTDYDVALPMGYFVSWAIRGNWGLFKWNPYISLGIPVMGDPTSVLFSPLFAFLVAGFGADTGMRLTLASSVILSGVSMWYFLRVMDIDGWYRIWGAMMYQMSGALMAAIASGHVNKFLAYPAIPIFLALVFKPGLNLRKCLFAALCLTYIFFSGEYYTVWFLSIFFLCIKGYGIINHRETAFRAISDTVRLYGLFIILASVKLIPFMIDVRPILVRFFDNNPTTGSVHFFYLPILYMLPWQVSFYDRPFFQRLIGFKFNWYEYYAFITPIPIFFLVKLKVIFRSYYFRLLIVICIVGSLYLAIGYWYSPFYWILKVLPFLGAFRIPQRIVMPLTAIVLALVMGVGQTILNSNSPQNRLFLRTATAISLIWLYIIGYRTISGAFEPVRTNELAAVNYLISQNPGRNYYVASFICCAQTYLVREQIPVLNMYYSWRSRYAPSFISPQTNQADYTALNQFKPEYIFAGNREDFLPYGYRKINMIDDIYIWKTDKPTVFPKYENKDR